jgi:hypothetical protein
MDGRVNLLQREGVELLEDVIWFGSTDLTYASDYQKAVADYDRVIQLAPSNPIVCGHRLLALHHGWDVGVVSTVYLQGAVQAGCQ